MDRYPMPDTDKDVFQIKAVQEAWLAAVRARDVKRLSELWTDDVVVVHGNGRCVCGKKAVEADFLEGLRRFAIDQKVSSAEVIVRGKWAFDISEVETVLTPVEGGQPQCARSTTVVVLLRQPNDSWRVSRVIGLPAL